MRRAGRAAGRQLHRHPGSALTRFHARRASSRRTRAARGGRPPRHISSGNARAPGASARARVAPHGGTHRRARQCALDIISASARQDDDARATARNAAAPRRPRTTDATPRRAATPPPRAASRRARATRTPRRPRGRRAERLVAAAAAAAGGARAAHGVLGHGGRGVGKSARRAGRDGRARAGGLAPSCPTPRVARTAAGTRARAGRLRGAHPTSASRGVRARGCSSARRERARAQRELRARCRARREHHARAPSRRAGHRTAEPRPARRAREGSAPRRRGRQGGAPAGLAADLAGVPRSRAGRRLRSRARRARRRRVRLVVRAVRLLATTARVAAAGAARKRCPVYRSKRARAAPMRCLSFALALSLYDDAQVPARAGRAPPSCSSSPRGSGPDLDADRGDDARDPPRRPSTQRARRGRAQRRARRLSGTARAPLSHKPDAPTSLSPYGAPSRTRTRARATACASARRAPARGREGAALPAAPPRRWAEVAAAGTRARGQLDACVGHYVKRGAARAPGPQDLRRTPPQDAHRLQPAPHPEDVRRWRRLMPSASVVGGDAEGSARRVRGASVWPRRGAAATPAAPRPLPGDRPQRAERSPTRAIRSHAPPAAPATPDAAPPPRPSPTGVLTAAPPATSRRSLRRGRRSRARRRRRRRARKSMRPCGRRSARARERRGGTSRRGTRRGRGPPPLAGEPRARRRRRRPRPPPRPARRAGGHVVVVVVVRLSSDTSPAARAAPSPRRVDHHVLAAQRLAPADDGHRGRGGPPRATSARGS